MYIIYIYTASPASGGEREEARGSARDSNNDDNIS